MSLHLVDDDGRLQEESKMVEFIAGCVAKSVAKGGPASAGRYEDILHSVGMNYHVVGVFGGQSSGKSTLLNHLFATDFQTLDETVRRGQTTKGAFLSKANTSLRGFEGSSGKPKSPLLVVDFEGTDGLERGENQSFERQLSLFGLSMADTLIINMWAVDVGRYNGANLSLLRTIFEVNLQLFSHESYEKDEKPTLLIVLRDFTDKDPTPSLTTVRKSFDTIWENISRPAEFANATIDALFTLKYYVMPHFKLQRKEFDESVTTLRRWFGDSQCKDFLFRHSAMFRGVPLEDLPQYMANCWEAILSSKDLDIPTQREMLAQHRCREAKQQELRNFQMFARQYEDRINRGEMLVRLSEVLDDEMDARMQEYARQTKLYNPEVAEGYAKELEQALVDVTMRVVDRLSSAVAAEVLAGLDARLQGAIDDCVNNLLKSAQSLPFNVSAAGGSGADPDAASATSFEGPQGRVLDHATRFYMNNPQCQEVIIRFWKALRSDLNALLNEMVVEPPPAHLYGRFVNLMAEDKTARGNVMNTVTAALFKKVSGRVSSMAESAAESIHRGFEQCLSHNSDGTVKFFATAKGLQQAVPMAQQGGLVLLGCLLYFRLQLAAAHGDGNGDIVDSTSSKSSLPSSRSARRVVQNRKRVSVRQEPYEKQFLLTYTTLDTAPRYPVQVPIARAPIDGEEGEPGVEASCVLLTQPQVQRAFEVFRQKCDFTTQIQLRSIEASRSQLPAWVLPALLVLGFNEIKYVLTSPTLLILVVIVGFLFFKNYIIAQWQAFEETGPATIVIPLQTCLRYIQDLYRENIEPQVQQLQQFQQQQQERLQAQHRPHMTSSNFSSPHGGRSLAAGQAGDDELGSSTTTAMSSSAAAVPRDAEVSASGGGGVRPRKAPVVAQPQVRPVAKQHVDPLQAAVADTKPTLPRRRVAPKEN